MTKALLALAGAAVALSSVPVAARTYSNVIKCSGWRNGQCVAWNRLTNSQAHDIGVGYVFPQNYTYVDVNGLPQTVVTQYHLTPSDRYVYSNGYVWVVDPTTYAVTRVITVPNP